MNNFEYKKRYDPDMDMYVKKNIHTGEIHGGALSDIFKTLFGKTMKKAVKTASKKAIETAATGEFSGQKAGDKIVQLLSMKNKTITTPVINQMTQSPVKKSTSFTIRNQ